MVALDAMSDKQFVYRLIISQLHYDGYNALALLMEQMLLSSQKVQPSDWLTQLLKVCKAVSIADKDLLSEKEEGTAGIVSDSTEDNKPTNMNPGEDPSLQTLISQSFINNLDLPPLEKMVPNIQCPISKDENCISPQKQDNKFLVPAISSPLTFISPSSCQTPLQYNLGPDFVYNPNLLNQPAKLEPTPGEDKLFNRDSGQEKLFQKSSLQEVVKALSSSRSPVSKSWPPASMLLGQPPLKQTNRQHKLKNCPVCRKVLVASSLYLHMKIHSGEKNYRCEFCNKKFLLKHHLHSHLKICPNRRPKIQAEPEIVHTMVD